MTVLESYNMAKRNASDCEQWAELLGAPYECGGGVVFGRLHRLYVARGDRCPTIYHQREDGAKNYWDMPSSFAPYLEAAITNKFDGLLSDALALQKAALKEVAAKAVTEYKELLDEAGLNVETKQFQ